MKLPIALYLRMLSHAIQECPWECVGILAGPKDGAPTEVFYGTNMAKDPTNTYQLDPTEQLGLEQAIEGAGLVPLAIYHSHPNMPAVASEFDRLTAFNPIVSIIIGVAQLPDVTVRAYRLCVEDPGEREEILEVV